MNWVDNTLLCCDRTLITIEGCNLLIRGEGFSGRKRKGDTPNTDRPRICKFDSPEQAKRVAEIIAQNILEEQF